jgi:hypothetical protein
LLGIGDTLPSLIGNGSPKNEHWPGHRPPGNPEMITATRAARTATTTPGSGSSTMGHIHQANACNGKGNGIEGNKVDQGGSGSPHRPG